MGLGDQNQVLILAHAFYQLSCLPSPLNLIFKSC